MIIKNRGAVPVIDKSAFVAPNATLVGNVRIGRDSRVMYGATLISQESRKNHRTSSPDNTFRPW